MSAKTVTAALSALLTLGTVPVAWAAGVADGTQVADLVPVDPPVMYYPPPPSRSAPPAVTTVTPKPAPGPAPSGAAPAAPANVPGKSVAAELSGGWSGGPAKDKDGKFSYCAIEGMFNSGHSLLVARNVKGELNLGIGIPGADLPSGQQWAVKVSVDNKLTRDRTGVAPRRDMLVVPNGQDDELFNTLMTGKELVFTSSADRIVFSLKGTKKILSDLKTCVEKEGNVPPFATATAGKDGAKAEPGKTTKLPDGLTGLLEAAGLRGFEPLSLDNIPRDQRPADLAWRFGPVVGGIRERQVGEDAALPALSDEFVEAMKKRCDGTSTATLNPVETVAGVSLRTGSVECVQKDGKVHVSLTFFLSRARLFTALFHEAAEQDIAMADKIRDNLAEVLRKLAASQPSAQETGAQTSGVQPSSDAPVQPPPAAPAATAPAAPAADKPVKP